MPCVAVIGERHDRVNVYVENEFSFALATSLVGEKGLYVGREITQVNIDEILSLDLKHTLLNKVNDLISRRPRTEKEIRQKLGQYNLKRAKSVRAYSPPWR